MIHRSNLFKVIFLRAICPKITYIPIRKHGYSPILNIKYDFAKISKKEADKKQKSKQKTKIKEELSDAQTLDLNKFEEDYQQIVQSFKEHIKKIKVGKLQPSDFQHIYMKIGTENYNVTALCQVAPKTINSVVISPYDQANLDIVQKAIQTSQSSYQVIRTDKAITVTLPSSSMKELKTRMIQKLKKLSNDHKQKMKKQRSDHQNQLKKYKKIMMAERYVVAEKQSKEIYDKMNETIDKLTKDKEKQLAK